MRRCMTSSMGCGTSKDNPSGNGMQKHNDFNSTELKDFLDDVEAQKINGTVKPSYQKNKLEDVEAQKTNGTVKSSSHKVAPDLGRLLATYQLVPTFERSDRHHCFIDSLENIDNLPPPVPPPTSKQQIFDLSKFSHVDDRAVKASKSLLKQPLSSLVEYLIDGYEDDLSKIRVIYRWITAQPIDQLNIPKKEPTQSHTLFQLWRIKHRKGNYAQLVSLLCRIAQLPCIIIHGKLKGSTYDVGEHLDDEQHYGEWNAVLIDGYWRFINAYWGTCAEGGSEDVHWECVDKGEEVKGDTLNKQLFYSCDENYFLTEPDQMISTHFPAEQAWQLKKDVISEDTFQTQAFLKDRFYNLHLKLDFPKICVIKSEGEIELQLQLPPSRAINLDFQYLLFRLRSSASGNLPRYDRYVFLQRKKPEILHMRVRSPVKDIFRFELVGKDVTIKDPGYDYDWVAVFKFDFTGSKSTDVDPFPECPVIGWGPGRAAFECGMAPMSHFSGEILPGNEGKLEVKFSTVNGKDWNKMDIKGQLIRGGSSPEEVTEHVVHRIENGDIIFNVATPKKGEYAFKVFANEEGEREPKNVCNYLITSNQKQENSPFPRNFSDSLGAKEAFHAMGLKALSHKSGFIETDQEEFELEFEKVGDVDLSLNLSGSLVHAEMAKRLISEEVNGNRITYTIRFPGNGNYGLRLMGNRGQGNEVLYDYVVQYKKGKQRAPKSDPEKTKPVVPEPVAPKDPDFSQDVPNDLRREIRKAIHDQNEIDLELALERLKELGLPTAKNDVENAEFELGVMKCRRELKEATEVRDMTLIKEAIAKTKQGGFEKRLPEELALAKAMLERLRNITKLMHAVLSLDQKTIAEIKVYQNPPPAVHRVMMATLLILGHWEEETEKWQNVQIALGKMGKEAIKRKIQELKVDEIPIDVALGARDLIRDFTLDQVRMVSAGGATFYVWVKGLTEEIAQRHKDVIGDIRPRTSSRRRRSTLCSEKSFFNS